MRNKDILLMLFAYTCAHAMDNNYDLLARWPCAGDENFVNLIAFWQWDDVKWQHLAMFRLMDFQDLSPSLQRLRVNHFWQMVAAIDPECKRARCADPYDPQARTFLHKAVQLGDKELVEAVLHYQKDVNAQDKIRRTPLQYALEAGAQDIVELLHACADVDQSSADQMRLIPVPTIAHERESLGMVHGPRHWYQCFCCR